MYVVVDADGIDKERTQKNNLRSRGWNMTNLEISLTLTHILEWKRRLAFVANPFTHKHGYYLHSPINIRWNGGRGSQSRASSCFESESIFNRQWPSKAESPFVVQHRGERGSRVFRHLIFATAQ